MTKETKLTAESLIRKKLDNYSLGYNEEIIIDLYKDIIRLKEALQKEKELHELLERNLNHELQSKEENKWTSVENGFPNAFETGDWDGKRSEFVLVEDESGMYHIGRTYSGFMDGSEFNDFFDNHNYEIENVKRWREI